MSDTEPTRRGAPPEFVRKAEIARRFGVTTRTITSWYSMGLPVVKVGARLNLHPLEKCRAWLMARGTSQDHHQ
jgi:phage terminase Nu1 subunit (DNA packaging protein)